MEFLKVVCVMVAAPSFNPTAFRNDMKEFNLERFNVEKQEGGHENKDVVDSEDEESWRSSTQNVNMESLRLREQESEAEVTMLNSLLEEKTAGLLLQQTKSGLQKVESESSDGSNTNASSQQKEKETSVIEKKIAEEEAEYDSDLEAVEGLQGCNRSDHHGTSRRTKKTVSGKNHAWWKVCCHCLERASLDNTYAESFEWQLCEFSHGFGCSCFSNPATAYIVVRDLGLSRAGLGWSFCGNFFKQAPTLEGEILRVGHNIEKFRDDRDWEHEAWRRKKG